MQYSPKLKIAMTEIQTILRRYDIGASVVLHTPGFSEYFLKLDPSYSCAIQDGDKIRVKAKLQEDFNGDKEAQIKKIGETVNLITHLADTNTNTSISMYDLLTVIGKVVDVDSDKGDCSSHTTQNN